MRGAAPPRAQALDSARRYARWRGVNPDEPEIAGLLDAAVEAAVHRAVRGEGRG